MYTTLINHHAKRMPQYRMGMIMNTNTNTEVTVIDASPAGQFGVLEPSESWLVKYREAAIEPNAAARTMSLTASLF
jgi:hypothetical protein